MTPKLTIKDFHIRRLEVGGPVTLILDWSDGTEEHLHVLPDVNVTQLYGDLMGSETTAEAMFYITKHRLAQVRP